MLRWRLASRSFEGMPAFWVPGRLLEAKGFAVTRRLPLVARCWGADVDGALLVGSAGREETVGRSLRCDDGGDGE